MKRNKLLVTLDIFVSLLSFEELFTLNETPKEIPKVNHGNNWALLNVATPQKILSILSDHEKKKRSALNLYLVYIFQVGEK